jgi:hypothetical protein
MSEASSAIDRMSEKGGGWRCAYPPYKHLLSGHDFL